MWRRLGRPMSNSRRRQAGVVDDDMMFSSHQLSEAHVSRLAVPINIFGHILARPTSDICPAKWLPRLVKQNQVSQSN